MLRRIVLTLATALAVFAGVMTALSVAGLLEPAARPGGIPVEAPIVDVSAEATTAPAAPAGGSAGVTGSLAPADPSTAAPDTSGGITLSVRPQLPGGMIAEDLLDRINRERVSRGLSRLEVNTSLIEAAQSWAVDMASNGYRHSPQDRLRNVLDGIGAGGISEIIHAPEPQCPVLGSTCSDPSAQPTSGVLHVEWLRSGDHRVAVLGENWDRIGIGVHCAANGRVYAVVLFASPADVYVDEARNVAYDEPRLPDNDGYTCAGEYREHNPAWLHTSIS